MKSATDADADDINNVEAWAYVIKCALYHVPPEHRLAVLALATANEEAERKKHEASGGLIMWTDLTQNYEKSPSARHHNAIVRLKSLLIQIFARDITNDHSPRTPPRSCSPPIATVPDPASSGTTSPTWCHQLGAGKRADRGGPPRPTSHH